MPFQQAFIALGANLGDRLTQCLKALEHLEKIPHTQIKKCSSFLETTPLERPGALSKSPDYINGVCEVRTTLSPLQLLHSLLDIEKKMGRVRTQKWEPRCIDLDLLAYGDCVMKIQDLILPHPEMIHRLFVLEPLSEIAPAWVHPIKKQTALQLMGRLKNSLKEAS